eukprot:m.211549 g.211549  ORF g.211549 m.211549 type:complete len:157 (+) comp10138_c5_seq76:373-843(+)
MLVVSVTAHSHRSLTCNDLGDVGGQALDQWSSTINELRRWVTVSRQSSESSTGMAAAASSLCTAHMSWIGASTAAVRSARCYQGIELLTQVIGKRLCCFLLLGVLHMSGAPPLRFQRFGVLHMSSVRPLRFSRFGAVSDARPPCLELFLQPGELLL